MGLNCPQRGDHLRLPQTGRRKVSRRSTSRRQLIGIALLVVAAGLLAGYFLLANNGLRHSHTADPVSMIVSPTSRPGMARLMPVAKRSVAFCEPGYMTTIQGPVDMADLRAAGGLVHLLKRSRATAPFTCAAYYLALGLDVNAVSADAGLTALLYAIKVNSPQMVRFVIGHGADLHQEAGAKRLQPMGYAYYLALNDPDTNRNRVIAIINNALMRSGRSGQ